MLLPDQVLLVLGPHELQLLASLVVAQGVDEQVQVVYLLNFPNELRDVLEELVWVHIVDQVNVYLVRTKKSESLAVLKVLNVFDDMVQHDDAWVDAF